MRRFALAPTLIALVAALALFGSALAQEAPLIVFGDMVYGHENPPEGRSCTLNNRFTHEQMVVWRVKVVESINLHRTSIEQSLLLRQHDV